MVHHIVMWKFKPEIEEAERPELKKAMNENLSELVGKVLLGQCVVCQCLRLFHDDSVRIPVLVDVLCLETLGNGRPLDQGRIPEPFARTQNINPTAIWSCKAVISSNTHNCPAIGIIGQLRHRHAYMSVVNFHSRFSLFPHPDSNRRLTL